MTEFIVLGSSGQLGRAFVEVLSQAGIQHCALDRSQADLARYERLELPLTAQTTLINCAANTQVDAAEADDGPAIRVNGDAVGELARRCADTGARFVHFSSDYVFNGDAVAPYREGHERDPVNAYGRSKARGEQLIEQLLPSTLLVRTSWVYAPWGTNFVRTMAKFMREREAVRVVDDQRGRPTHVLGLAQRTLGLLERNQTGIFHITDGGECTWFEFAQAIAAAIGTSCRVEPCTSEEFARPAKRPAYSVLDTTRADAVLGPATHYRKWLEDCVRRGL